MPADAPADDGPVRLPCQFGVQLFRPMTYWVSLNDPRCPLDVLLKYARARA